MEEDCVDLCQPIKHAPKVIGLLQVAIDARSTDTITTRVDESLALLHHLVAYLELVKKSEATACKVDQQVLECCISSARRLYYLICIASVVISKLGIGREISEDFREFLEKHAMLAEPHEQFLIGLFHLLPPQDIKTIPLNRLAKFQQQITDKTKALAQADIDPKAHYLDILYELVWKIDEYIGSHDCDQQGAGVLAVHDLMLQMHSYKCEVLEALSRLGATSRILSDGLSVETLLIRYKKLFDQTKKEVEQLRNADFPRPRVQQFSTELNEDTERLIEESERISSSLSKVIDKRKCDDAKLLKEAEKLTGTLEALSSNFFIQIQATQLYYVLCVACIVIDDCKLGCRVAEKFGSFLKKYGHIQKTCYRSLVALFAWYQASISKNKSKKKDARKQKNTGDLLEEIGKFADGLEVVSDDPEEAEDHDAILLEFTLFVLMKMKDRINSDQQLPLIERWAFQKQCIQYRLSILEHFEMLSVSTIPLLGDKSVEKLKTEFKKEHDDLQTKLDEAERAKFEDVDAVARAIDSACSPSKKKKPGQQPKGKKKKRDRRGQQALPSQRQSSASKPVEKQEKKKEPSPKKKNKASASSSSASHQTQKRKQVAKPAPKPEASEKEKPEDSAVKHNGGGALATLKKAKKKKVPNASAASCRQHFFTACNNTKELLGVFTDQGFTVIRGKSNPINYASVSTAVVQLANTLKLEGYTLLLIGGSPRDLWYNAIHNESVHIADWDAITDAPWSVLREVAYKVSRAVPEKSITLVIDGVDIDVVSIANNNTHLERQEVVGAIRESCSKRDLTANALLLFVDVNNFCIIGFPEYIKDFQEHRLCSTIDGVDKLTAKYHDEPILILRALRIARKLSQFKLDETIVQAIQKFVKEGIGVRYLKPWRYQLEKFFMTYPTIQLAVDDLIKFGLFEWFRKKVVGNSKVGYYDSTGLWFPNGGMINSRFEFEKPICNDDAVALEEAYENNHGQGLDVKNSQGLTALQFAINKKAPKCFAYLLMVGADVSWLAQSGDYQPMVAWSPKKLDIAPSASEQDDKESDAIAMPR